MGDFGAEVIKAELPVHGDTLRNVAPMYENRSLYWSVLGRNKCSITLDLRVPRGRDEGRQGRADEVRRRSPRTLERHPEGDGGSTSLGQTSKRLPTAHCRKGVGGETCFPRMPSYA